MQEFLWEYRYVIAALLAIILFAIFNFEKAKVVAYNGMLRAKSMAKDAVLNSGQEQEDWVVDHIYPYLPIGFKLVVNKNLFRKFVKWLYQMGKDWIDDGKMNQSI